MAWDGAAAAEGGGVGTAERIMVLSMFPFRCARPFGEAFGVGRSEFGRSESNAIWNLGGSEKPEVSESRAFVSRGVGSGWRRVWVKWCARACLVIAVIAL